VNVCVSPLFDVPSKLTSPVISLDSINVPKVLVPSYNANQAVFVGIFPSLPVSAL
jgi:hypothetical protein